MLVNVRNFENIIRKATVGFLVDFISLNVTQSSIKSKMINSPDRTCVSIINTHNNVFVFDEKAKNDEFQLNFDDPATNVIPFLSSIEEEEVTMKKDKSKVELISDGAKIKLSISEMQDSRVFLPDAPKAHVRPFMSIDIDDNFMKAYNKIKKIAPKFGKTYISLDQEFVYLETTDKENPASNGVRAQIGERPSKYDNDVLLYFPFKTFSGVINTVSSLVTEENKVKMELSFVDDIRLGVIKFDCGPDHTYYLMSSKSS